MVVLVIILRTTLGDTMWSAEVDAHAGSTKFGLS